MADHEERLQAGEPGVAGGGDRSLDGRVALVTGAGRGLGRAHAIALARAGAAVVVNDVGTGLDGRGSDPDPARDVVAMITGAGGRAVADGSDVGSIEGGRQAVQRAIDAYGRIDIVVNNAGIPGGGGGLDHPVEAELDLLFGVHYRGPVGTMSAAVPFMRTRGFGRIVNIVSEVALDARTASGFGYGAAKAALWSATLGVANQVVDDGITVNAVSPGARTRMNADLLDQGFRGGASNDLDLNPDHVARVVVYLCLPEAGDITGRVIHAAAGSVREYSTIRSSRTELVARIQAVLDAPPGRRLGDGP